MIELENTSIFDEWNNALQTRDPEQVANLYADNVQPGPSQSRRNQRLFCPLSWEESGSNH